MISTRRLRTLGRLLGDGDLSRVWRTLALDTFPASLLHLARFHLIRGSVEGRRGRPQPNVVTRWATPSDLPALVQIANRPASFSRYFEQGRSCIITFFEGIPATMTWFDQDRPHTSGPHGYEFRNPPGSAWVFSGATAPGLRGRGLYAAHWHSSWPMLEERGLRIIYGTIFGYNQTSLITHRKLGFESMCEVVTLSILGMRCYRVVDFRQGRSGFGRGALILTEPDQPTARVLQQVATNGPSHS
jgi:hypothetical protein